MIYMNENLEIVETKHGKDEGHLYQIHIPRTPSCIPKFFVNKGNKTASATDTKKVIKALEKAGYDLSLVI